MMVSSRLAWTVASITVAAASISVDLAAQVCSGSANPERFLVELSAVEKIENPNVDARVFGDRLFAEVGLGRSQDFVAYGLGSDGAGIYLSQLRVRQNEARAGVGWRLPVGVAELCAKSGVAWSRPSGAEEDRFYLDAFGRIIDFVRVDDAPTPSWSLLTLRGAVALGAEFLPDWSAGVEVFGRQYRPSDRPPGEKLVAEAGLVGSTSVVLAARVQLRLAVSWVGWDNIDESDGTYNWVTAAVGLLF